MVDIVQPFRLAFATDAETAAVASTSKALTPSNLASGRACFDMVLSADQTGIASNTATKVAFNTSVTNTGGYFDTGNNRWVPPAGRVRLSANIRLGNVTALGTCVVQIRKNGSVISGVNQSGFSDTAGLTGYVSVSGVVIANGTDYFEVWVTAPSATTVTVSNTGTISSFSGEQI